MTTIIETGEAGEPESAAAELPPESAEALGDAAVEIARIEGETQVRLAELDNEHAADLNAAMIEADAAFGEALAENINSDLEAERDQWKTRAEAAELELANLRAAEPSIPQPSEPLPNPDGPSAAESGQAQDDPAAAEEPAAAESPAEPPKRKRKDKWI